MSSNSFGVFALPLVGRKSFAIGLGIALAGLGVGYFIWGGAGALAQDPSNLTSCSGTAKGGCKLGEGVKISGMAQMDPTRYLVVHDANSSPSELDFDRLGIITMTSPTGPHEYVPIKIPRVSWDGISDRNVASDLESACELTESANQYLVAESGDVFMNSRGNSAVGVPPLGRIFHVTLTVPIGSTPANATVSISTSPTLTLPKRTQPPTAWPLPGTDNKFIHSRENFEGMACADLGEDIKGNRNYLVIVGERGGNDPGFKPPLAPPLGATRKASLRWGTYKVVTNEADREIIWDSALLNGIVAPGKGKDEDQPHANWRDITGLHVDDQGILWASAAFDTDEDFPPYGGVIYRLGYVCLKASDSPDGQICNQSIPDFCPATAIPKVCLFKDDDRTVVSRFSRLKPEAVAEAAGPNPAKGTLSVGTEDEKAGGSFWPKIP